MGYNYRNGGMPEPHTGIASDSTSKSSKSKPQGDGHAEAETMAADKQEKTYYNLGLAQNKAEVNAEDQGNNIRANVHRNEAMRNYNKADSVAKANRGKKAIEM